LRVTQQSLKLAKKQAVLQQNVTNKKHLSQNLSLNDAYICCTLSLIQIQQREQKLMGENLKGVWAKFSTLKTVVKSVLHSIHTNTHFQSLKLGPGFVLLDKVCPWTQTLY
jgi:hypothetical protein